MPLIECGYPGAPDQLVFLGPTVKVRVGFSDELFDEGEAGAFVDIEDFPGVDIVALIDTGANHSCIDERVARRLNLTQTDRKTIVGSTGSVEVPVYLAHFYLPDLKYLQWGQFSGIDLAASGQQYDALLGRDLLQSLTLGYDGTAGGVTLSI